MIFKNPGHNAFLILDVNVARRSFLKREYFRSANACFGIPTKSGKLGSTGSRVKANIDIPEYLIMLTNHPHTPNHLFLDQTMYFVSGAIYQKRHLLAQPEHKALLLQYIREYYDKFKWELFYWVILDNNYHLILRSLYGKDLTLLFKAIHSCSAIDIHRDTRCEKPVWWNYWDYCPRNEKDTIIRINYLLYNPVRHGYVKNLQDYPYSSFHHEFEKLGRAALVEQFQAYPEYKTLVLHEAHKDDF